MKGIFDAVGNGDIFVWHSPGGTVQMIKIYRNYVPARSLLFIVVDVTLLFVVLNIATHYTFQGGGGGWSGSLFSVTALSILLVATTALSGVAAGVYRQDIGHMGPWLGTAGTAVGLALTFGSVVVLASRFFHAAPPISLAHWEIGLPAVWPISFFLTRWVERAAARRGYFTRRILLIGAGANATEIEAFARRIGSTIEVAERIDPDTVKCDLSIERLKSRRIREVVIAVDDQKNVPMELLLQWKLSGIAVTDCLTFWEREAGHIALGAFDPAWFVYGEGCHRNWLGRGVKRAIDVVVAVLLLIVTSPLLLLFAALIRLESEGPVFYRQVRTGRYGKPFTILKFRSMRADAEAATPQWAAAADPRVTRVGKFMRSTRIDELPQLLTVIRGDMSLIGPRPERPFFVDQLDKAIPHYNDRHYVRPGLTGWAQINYPYGASIADARRKLAYDLYYVKNQSTLLDLYIMIATVRVILLREGSR
ncbi:MAG TPA: TIGR03013 family XrtA/PEP-CTERM system glycosyltransferase [Bradyrhizobium sp.]|nr:TIGR03013 family XrtA/PEP-CTERM system glycosyltransferase [Bradyrhizobium sp.]